MLETEDGHSEVGKHTRLYTHNTIYTRRDLSKQIRLLLTHTSLNTIYTRRDLSQQIRHTVVLRRKIRQYQTRNKCRVAELILVAPIISSIHREPQHHLDLRANHSHPCPQHPSMFSQSSRKSPSVNHKPKPRLTTVSRVIYSRS